MIVKARHVPQRKCVACHEQKNKKQLIRIVRTPQTEVQIDITGKKSGRGAYLCRNVSCFQLAKKQRSLDRVLKIEIINDIYDTLARDFIRIESEADEEDDHNE
jgi:predicted RNA-binding protein YlxR (DUF448 family)